MVSPIPIRARSAGALALLTAASLCVGVIVASPATAEAAYEDVLDGLVHRFKLDETSGTLVVNSGTAGAAADATLVNPEKAVRGADGIRFNPDDYADALTGAYVRLPNDLTAGMN